MNGYSIFSDGFVMAVAEADLARGHDSEPPGPVGPARDTAGGVGQDGRT